MQPNFKGEFCLNNISITDFISRNTQDNYKKLWELLFKLNKNLEKNSPQQENDEIIQEINQQLNLMSLEDPIKFDDVYHPLRQKNTKANYSKKIEKEKLPLQEENENTEDVGDEKDISNKEIEIREEIEVLGNNFNDSNPDNSIE